MKPTIRWAIEWASQTKLEGRVEFFCYPSPASLETHAQGPCLFRTRDAAREYIRIKYGYIRNRPDLRAEPHGWKMPRPVKVKIILQKVAS